MLTSDTRKRLTTLAQAVAVAGTALALTACGSGTPAATSSNTTAPLTPTAQGRFDQQAVQTLDSIVQRDFDGATAHFDSTMQQKLSAQTLASAWDRYQQQFGAYESHGDPQDVAGGDLTVVNIPLKMATLPGEFRVTFHDGDGTVAGLYLLKTGIPVP